MTVEEIIAKIQADPQVKAMHKNLRSGNASFSDTWKYQSRVSDLLGEMLSANMHMTPAALRKEMCQALLKESYENINSIMAQIQKEIDTRQGIHIAPQKAPYPAERVEKVADSLTDPTVKESVIERRAKSATATVSRSFHDDYVKTNAKFRSRAGLKCYITRETDGTCCKWCSAMAGRYDYGSEPKDVYRRHDNCGCSVTYENGRQRQDVWSKREWEAPEPGAGAGDPVVFTAEQARELEAKHLPEVLTNGEKHDIMNIRLDDIKTAVTGSPISEEVAEYIFSVLAEQRDQFKFDSVRVLALDPKIVMQTDPVQNGTFYDIVLNLNSNFLGGRSVEELDEKLRQSNYTRANSLREAVIHEIYHGRLLYDKNAGEMKALHEILDDEHIDGVSQTAFKNGFECISEVGVLYERGETADIPQKAMDLFHYYMRR